MASRTRETQALAFGPSAVAEAELEDREEVLEEVGDDAVLDDDELGLVAALAHEHRAIDGLAAGEELRLGEDRRAAAHGVA